MESILENEGQNIALNCLVDLDGIELARQEIFIEILEHTDAIAPIDIQSKKIQSLLEHGD